MVLDVTVECSCSIQGNFIQSLAPVLCGLKWQMAYWVSPSFCNLLSLRCSSFSGLLWLFLHSIVGIIDNRSDITDLLWTGPRIPTSVHWVIFIKSKAYDQLRWKGVENQLCFGRRKLHVCIRMGEIFDRHFCRQSVSFIHSPQKFCHVCYALYSVLVEKDWVYLVRWVNSIQSMYEYFITW